jgi:hypothetical protein
MHDQKRTQAVPMITLRFIAAWLLFAFAGLCACAAEPKVQVTDFSQPLALDRAPAQVESIVGLVLEVSGQATQPITVKVKCGDALVRQFEVSGKFSHRVKMDAYSTCPYLVFESTSFVGSTMTVTYSYATL